MMTVDLVRYLQSVRRRARPTLGQSRRFAGFLAHDHSWYKHLPLKGAGEPFFLFLDPNVHALLVENESGAHSWRGVTREDDERHLPVFRVDLQPGDIKPDTGPLSYVFSGTSTANYREQLGFWSYWNYGHPNQAREEAIAFAAGRVQVGDDEGRRISVPTEVLELGLVYLRATIYGDLGPKDELYERLRQQEDLPDPLEDQAVQIDEILVAMERVVARVYEGGSLANRAPA